MQATIDREIHSRQLTCRVKVEYVRDGNIASIIEQGLQLLKENQFNACYLFAEINDLTTPYAKRYCVLDYHDIPNLVDSKTDKLEMARTKLMKITPNILICHLIGISLDVYNKLEEGAMLSDQTIIDMSTDHINHAISLMNSDRNAVGPWLSDTVHANINGRHVHKYA